MKLSVIVPVYNLSAYIKDCLRGLVNQQTNFEYEIIVCDDASTDDSLEIIQKIALESSRLKVLQNINNVGLAKTQKKLLAETKGEYIAYLDGDDLALPGKLQSIVDYFESNPTCSFLHHEVEVFDSDSGITKSLYCRDYYNAKYIPQKANVEHLIRFGCFIDASAIAFRRHSHLLEAVDEGCKIILDHPWHILNAIYGGGTIDFIPKILGKYRIHSASFGGQTRRSPERREQVLADQLRACDNAADLGVDRNIIEQGKAHYRFATALYFLKLGDFERFKRFIQESVLDNWFFDERHQYALKNKENPEAVYAYLFETVE